MPSLHQKLTDRILAHWLPLAALPMADTSQIETRLWAILDPTRRQAMVTQKTLIVALLATTTVLAPLASLRPVVATNLRKETSPPLRGEVVVIDPGHGARDAGAVTAGNVTEKVLNLQIAQRLRSLLQQRGAVVYMTRDGDTFLNFQERHRLAEEKHADCLISIHCDGEKPDGRSGAAVYYHADDESERRLAEEMNGNIGQITRCPGHVLSDSTRFRTGFGVLRDASMPAVLVECGFMESSRDLARLRDPQGQQRIAEGVALGLTTFCGRP